MTRGAPPTFGQALHFWVKLGFISFGGPTGQIAIMQTELVDRRGWISQAHFLHALNFCMLLPGPEAMQLATYIGWLLHRTAGGLAAGLFFIIPSIFILLALSYVYAAFGTLPWIAALFYGLKPAVLAIVASATLRIGARALRHPLMYLVAAAAFSGLFFFHLPFPVIIAAAGGLGFIGGRWRPDLFAADAARSASRESSKETSGQPLHTRPSTWRAIRVILVALTFWVVPLVALKVWRGGGDVFFKEAVFFSKAAMVTFGGAYAVLPYVAQQAVEKYHWLSAVEMMDGLGLAETTPGPLIMVLQFVGFMAGWRQAGDLGLAGAVLGGLTATYFTFMPCFLWIFLGAPYIEQTRTYRGLAGALGTITAAVVGVVLNLAVWFGLHVLWPPTGGVDWFALGLTTVSFVGLQRYRWGIVPVVTGAALLGLLYQILVRGLLGVGPGA